MIDKAPDEPRSLVAAIGDIVAGLAGYRFARNWQMGKCGSGAIRRFSGVTHVRGSGMACSGLVLPAPKKAVLKTFSAVVELRRMISWIPGN